MQKHLVLVEKSGELPHYQLLNCDDNTLQVELRHYKGSYPQRDGYKIKVMAPGSYTQPLGERISSR